MKKTDPLSRLRRGADLGQALVLLLAFLITVLWCAFLSLPVGGAP